MTAIMTRQIDATEAHVNVVSVEIKTMTIGKKQMTLSVFRQLPIEPLFDSALEPMGVPWGKVNYFPGGCEHLYEHLHVIWQRGNTLYRACVYPDHSKANGWGASVSQAFEVLGDLVVVAMCRADFMGAARYYERMNTYSGIYEFVAGERIEPMSDLLYDVKTAFGEIRFRPKADADDLWRSKAQRFITDSALPELREAQLEWERAKRCLTEFAATWNARYAEMQALDQLFIAV